MSKDLLLLGVDTCGPSGSVALARLSGGKLVILGQTELAGRSYSATLIAATGELMARTGKELRQLNAIVVVNGPGSFTGVRVGLSAVKGLAEAARIPVVALSRLAVLAHKAEVSSAALDAHRHELFLRLSAEGAEPRELLAGSAELVRLGSHLISSHPASSYPGSIAVCDEAATRLLSAAWPWVELIHVAAPTAADALDLAVPRVRAGEFADVALLDGHYLRRSDAEIFGEPAPATAQRA
jgi:tRNA threonylcarbamoyladenosine biosynthesis protein TsaB